MFILKESIFNMIIQMQHIYISESVTSAGHNKIKMTDLLCIISGSGFNDAETFIQSGNVIFHLFSGMSVRDISLRLKLQFTKSMINVRH